MRDLAEVLAEQPFFRGLDTDALALLAGCARIARVDEDTYLFRAGEPAERFYVVRHGRIALELHSPDAGPVIVDTVDDGEVIGWSWLVPPHRWFFDARAVQPSSMLVLDGSCLRGKCDSDPALGYQLLQRVAGVMYHRLQAARVRLLDLYGTSHARRR